MTKAEKSAYMTEWTRNNPDKAAAIRKKWKDKKRPEIAAKARKYHADNRDKVLARQKLYREKNRDKLLIKKKQDYQKNKDRYSLKSKEWRVRNAELIREQDHFKYLKTMKSAEGFFYIAKFDNFIKIGTAKNWENRKKAYSNHNPIKLELLKCSWYEGANIKEKEARWHLRQYKLKGKDWFVNVPQEDINIMLEW